MVVPRDYDVRYGRHDFVIGINRWAIRVLAYTSLMRDEYPPLRLDMGPREPEPPGRISIRLKKIATAPQRATAQGPVPVHLRDEIGHVRDVPGFT